ncbi:hypothetical protein O4J55_09760, partial [Paracoccus sp. PXZ]
MPRHDIAETPADETQLRRLRDLPLLHVADVLFHRLWKRETLIRATVTRLEDLPHRALRRCGIVGVDIIAGPGGGFAPRPGLPASRRNVAG